VIVSWIWKREGQKALPLFFISLNVSSEMPEKRKITVKSFSLLLFEVEEMIAYYQ
jgi:hypothetical protein